MTTPLRVGTRASLLARTQAGHVADALAAALGREVDAGRGDHRGRRLPGAARHARRGRRLRRRAARRAAARRGRRRRALAQGPADRRRRAASRSPPCPPREDPRDVVVARDGLTLGELPAGSRVGTGSPRRAAQLHALGLGLDVVADPRQRRHPDRQGAARARSTPCVLARAGLARHRPARRGHRGARPAADAARPGPGRAGGRVPHRRRRARGRGRRRARRPRPPGPRSPPSARCWPTSRPGAARPSARWPRSSRATTARSCGCAPSRSRPTGRSPSGGPRPVRRDRADEVGRALAAEMVGGRRDRPPRGAGPVT